MEKKYLKCEDLVKINHKKERFGLQSESLFLYIYGYLRVGQFLLLQLFDIVDREGRENFCNEFDVRSFF